MDSNITQAAARILQAHENKQVCEPIRDLISKDDVGAAYEVQQINTRHWINQGHRPVGKKIGLTSLSVQKQLGVEQPDFGVLFDHMALGDAQEIPLGSILQPKVEAEVALVIKRDLCSESHTLADIISATAYALPAIEILGSRIRNWDISLVDTIADNASSGMFVLGSKPTLLSDIDLYHCGMVMERRGEQVSSGAGAACLGNPLNAAVWLADTMVAMGSPMRAGDIILTGAIGPMVEVTPGDVFEVRINGLGEVRARFAAES